MSLQLRNPLGAIAASTSTPKRPCSTNSWAWLERVLPLRSALLVGAHGGLPVVRFSISHTRIVSDLNDGAT